MAEFDPERFEEEKYVDYFTELQDAYKRAFDVMNERYDSTLVHGIDQQVLNESEPFFERASSAEGASGDRAGEFRVELPENPYDRLQGVAVSEEKFEEVLDRYVDLIERELHEVFGVER